MWQVVSNGRPVGTFTEADLVRWSYEGRVNRQDLLWKPGMSAALPAHVVLPFAAILDAVPPRSLGPDRTMRWLLPVGRSGWAIAAGYLGLFSVLLLPAPFALLAGIIAIVDIRRHQGRHGLGRATFGVVAGGLGCLVLVGVILGRFS